MRAFACALLALLAVSLNLCVVGCRKVESTEGVGPHTADTTDAQKAERRSEMQQMKAGM